MQEIQTIVEKIQYPAFWQYTTHDNLYRLIPPGFTREKVILKELIDNACDSAEKFDHSVSIIYQNNKFIIANKGTLTLKDLNVITDFSKRISEKYYKKRISRGAIGHGLKIALMMNISMENQIIIKSAGYQHVLTIIDRQSYDPKKVLDINSIKIDMPENTTIIELNMPCNEDAKAYILNYITLNPHISFEYNYNFKYSKMMDYKKNTNIDIHSYTKAEFDDLSKIYNINSLFADKLPKYAVNVYDYIKKRTKPIKPVPFGEQVISQRLASLGINLKAYKHFFMGAELFEIGLIDKKYIVGVNNSAIDPSSLYIIHETEKNRTSLSLKTALHEFKIEGGFFLSYQSTKINFMDTNKQTVFINDKKVYDEIKNLAKKFTKTEDQWLIKKDEYLNWAKRNNIVNESSQYNIKPHTYVFMLHMQNIVKELNKRYGAVTVRQLYYQLVKDGIITNNLRSYNNFDNHLTNARELGIIEYDAFEDRSRRLITLDTIPTDSVIDEYIVKTIQDALRTPTLNIWDEQEYYLELWIEKDALLKLFQKIAFKYQVPIFPSRGYTSATKIEEARKRFVKEKQKGKKAVIAYAGDFDPSGWNIYENIENKLGKDALIDRFALNNNQFDGLLPMPIKETDTRYQNFINMFPDAEGCYELDAFDPDELMLLTEKTINKYYISKTETTNKIKQWNAEFNLKRNKIMQIFLNRQV